MILDPNGSSFDNDKAHAFWHSDTGQSVLKVIKAATKDSGSGGGSDGTFVPNDPGHGGRTYSDMLAEPTWERAEDATAWGDPVWRAEIFNRGDERIYGILRDDESTVLDFIDNTAYLLQVSAALNDLQRLANAGVTGLLARIEKPDATERAFNALAYLPDSGDAPRLVLYAFGAKPPEGVEIWVTATLLDWGGLG